MSASWRTSLVLGAALVACDRLYADPITTSFVPAAVDAGTSATRPAPSPCSTIEPSENSPCFHAGAVCEYGSSADLACNRFFACESDPAFGTYWTERARGRCAGRCPDPATIQEGAPCDPADAGSGDGDEVQCTTATSTCACTTGPDGAHVHPRQWVCRAPAEDCPRARPVLGAPCVGRHVCDYGACDFKRGARMICEDDVWQLEAATCP